MLIHFEQKYSKTDFVQNEWMKNDIAYYVRAWEKGISTSGQTPKCLNSWIQPLWQSGSQSYELNSHMKNICLQVFDVLVKYYHLSGWLCQLEGAQ